MPKDTTRNRVALISALILASWILACSEADSDHDGNIEGSGETESKTEALTCQTTCNTPNYNATAAAPTCTPLPCGSPSCARRFMGGLLWPDGQIPYRLLTSFTDPATNITYNFTTGPNSDVATITSAISSWNGKMADVVRLFDCQSNGTCGQFYRVLTIRPNPGDVGSTGYRDSLQCLGDGSSCVIGGWVLLAPGVTMSKAAHEIGHAIGFDHTFNRADRDRFEKFSSSYFCTGNPLPMEGLYTGREPQFGEKGYEPAFPSIPTGSYGVYDELSVMTYPSADICETATTCEPTPNDPPTAADGSAAIELYRTGNEWAPFYSLGTDAGRCAQLNYRLDPAGSTVNMVGSPAVTSFGLPSLDVFVRGSDGNIYQKSKIISAGFFAGWSAWSNLGGSTFNSDPAAVSWDAGRIDLFARKSDGNLYQKTFANGAWGGWTSRGKPSGTTIASAPAVASWGANRLDVFVRGGDSRLYQLTFSGSPANWGSWSGVGMATFAGRPAAVARTTNDILVVTRSSTGALSARVFNGTWQSSTSLGVSMDSDASPALASWGASRADVFYKRNGILYQLAWMSGWMIPVPLGGLISSASGSGDPAVVAKASPFKRIDVVAPINDHGARGVWWKYYPFARPCTLGAGCGECHPDDPDACHKAADFYGIKHNVTFGFAPPEVQNWWSNVAHCDDTATSSKTTLCQNVSNQYAMATGSFNGAPAEAQAFWNANACTATPQCQGLSDLYGIHANVTFGYAPTAVANWWSGHSCATTPALPIDLCQRAADTFAITAGPTTGFPPSSVQTWWTQQGCNAKAHF